MSHENLYHCESINMETILAKKCELQQQRLLEPVLSSNLDYAARMFTYMHPANSSATLCVIGGSMIIKFLPNCESGQTQRGSVHFVVTSHDGQPHLQRYVTCGDLIKRSHMKEAHFSEHSCQDQVQSCLKQARALVPEGKGLKNTVIHIICNELSLTYSTGSDAGDGYSDYFGYGYDGFSESQQTTEHNVINTRIVLKTQCRLVFRTDNRLKELLQMKCWFEQEKPHKKNLIACMDLLLNKFITLDKPLCSCTFILQGDGEMVELVQSSGVKGTEYFIFGGPKGVSVFPSRWEKDGF